MNQQTFLRLLLSGATAVLVSSASIFSSVAASETPTVSYVEAVRIAQEAFAPLPSPEFQPERELERQPKEDSRGPSPEERKDFGRPDGGPRNQPNFRQDSPEPFSSERQNAPPRGSSPESKEGVGPSPFKDPNSDGRFPGEPSFGGPRPFPGGEGQEFGEGNRDQGQQEFSEEDFEKQQAEQEERMKKQQERALKDMKRGIAQAAKGVKQMRGFFDKMTKKAIAIPAECADALVKIEAIVTAVQAATTFEEVEAAAPEDMQEHFEIVMECRGKLDILSRVPQMLKKIDKEIIGLDRQWTRAKKSATDAAAEAVTDGDSALLAIKAGRARLDELAKAGDVEEMKGVMEDEIFSRYDDVTSAIQRLEAVKNARRYLSQFTRQMRDAERTIARLKKLGKDTVLLEELLVQTKAKHAEVKALKTGSEEWQEAIEELADLGGEFAGAAGGTEDADESFGRTPGAFGSVPTLRLPTIPDLFKQGQHGQQESEGFGF